jgi:hypothetical protein
LGWEDVLRLYFWGGFGGGLGGNELWKSAEKSSSMPMYGELVSADDVLLAVETAETLRAAPV